MSALSARDLFYLYRAVSGDVAALRGLSLEIADGEIVAALGPSGAGKTTFLALAAGFVRPSSGELTVLGERFDHASRRRAAATRRDRIGIVRQHYHEALPHELTVEEIVALPRRLLGGSRREASGQVAALLERAGLADRTGARPPELSGGEQQRVALCAALAKQPRLILADEPTGELDADARDTVVELLVDLTRAFGAAALIVTHDTRVAERADRTIHVRDGRLAAEGTDAPVLIVDDQGWIRLPKSLRERAVLGDRVRAAASLGRIELSAESEPVEPVPAPAPPRPAPAERDEPAGVEVVLERVVKRYGDPRRRPVVDLTWSAEPGRLHVIGGPSGSGKTTLLNLIAGLDRPDSGEIHVGQERVDRLGPDDAAGFRRRTVGHLSQHSTLVDYMTAAENVELALTLRGADPALAAERARRWLAWVGLEKLADRRADHLSGGEQRRVALARALAPAPRLLLADEPTAHLDQLAGRTVIQLLQAAAAETGATVIATSHDPDVHAAADTLLNLDTRVEGAHPPARGPAPPSGTWTAAFESAGAAASTGRRPTLRATVAAVSLATAAAVLVALTIARPWQQPASDSALLDRLRAAIAPPDATQILYQRLTISPGRQAHPLRIELSSWTTGGGSPRRYRATVVAPVAGPNGARFEQIGVDATLGPRYVDAVSASSRGTTYATIAPDSPLLDSVDFDLIGLVRTALDTDKPAPQPTLAAGGDVIRVRLTIRDSRQTLGHFTYVANAHTYRPIEVDFPRLTDLSAYVGQDLGFGGVALAAPVFGPPGDPTAQPAAYRFLAFRYEQATPRARAFAVSGGSGAAGAPQPAGPAARTGPACVRPFAILYKGRCVKTAKGAAGT
jgi:ABC-type lipoprotein export system ATPase subunit